jgi:plastocyanin
MRNRWVAAGAVWLFACGGADYGGSGGGGGPTPPPPSAGAVALTASGVDPKALTLAAGSTVVFTNNDSAAHEIASNPHPGHTQCPELNLGALSPGESRTMTIAAHDQPCGFHDHMNPDNAAFHGTITVTSGGGGGGGGGGGY